MASRKRSREDGGVVDDEGAPHIQREKVVGLSGAGVKGGERGGRDEVAAAKGCLEGQLRPVQERELEFVDPLPKLVVLDLDKTVR